MKLSKNDGVRLAGSDALRNASIDDLRVLVCLFEDDSLTGEALADAAGCSLSRATGALSYWKEAGVIEQTENGYRRRTSYYRTGNELQETIERRSLTPLLDGCQSILSHTLNDTELNALVDLTDTYALDAEYILTLLQYCVENGHGSIAYMEKVAIDWSEKGITTGKALDLRIKAEKEKKTTEGIVRRLFGIRDRALTKAEKEAVARWTAYGFTEDVIGMAYDITVGATGKASVAYASKILIKWYENGCHTLADCEAFTEKERAAHKATLPTRSKTGAAPAKENRSFDTADFFKKALERSYAGHGADGAADTDKGEGSGK